jgi:hypothetical protein
MPVRARRSAVSDLPIREYAGFGLGRAASGARMNVPSPDHFQDRRLRPSVSRPSPIGA